MNPYPDYGGGGSSRSFFFYYIGVIMSKHIPTMSVLGWVSAPEEVGSYALSCFFTSNRSQSVLTQTSIASLSDLVKRYGNDENQLQKQAQEILERHMRGYFGERVSTQVAVIEKDPNKPGQLTIRLTCIIREDTREITLGRLVKYKDGVLFEIIRENNG